MSSSYYTLCLSHDPAITYRSDYRSAADALADITAGAIDEHPHCDLVVMRVSGGPSELACPPSTQHRPGGCIAHSDPVWIDADVLRCLAAVRRSKLPEINATADATRLFGHWPPQRLQRLRHALDMPGLDDPTEKADRP